MRGVALLLVGLPCCLSLLTQAAPAAADVLRAIDDAYRAGQLSDDDRILYRVAAVRAPQALPQSLRQHMTFLRGRTWERLFRW